NRLSFLLGQFQVVILEFGRLRITGLLFDLFQFLTKLHQGFIDLLIRGGDLLTNQFRGECGRPTAPWPNKQDGPHENRNDLGGEEYTVEDELARFDEDAVP